jgi:thiosulfate dehydrogenase [quinone] large subunit
MNTAQKISLFVLRVSLGWLFFYAGITKVLNPEWSAAGYIGSAKSFPELYSWFLQPNILPLVNLANEWGLTLIGAALFIGIFVRWASLAGIILMALYYFAALDFPHPSANSYIVDEHIIYIGVFLVLAASKAGRAWGVDGKLGR